MWPELIGAGASLLGGILGRPKQKSAEQNSREALMGQAAGARAAADKYGFNPLTLLGVSSAVGPSESSAFMGQAIADAGMMLADGLAQRRDAGALSLLQQQNRELQEQVQSLTLRPRVGGVFAQREAATDDVEVLGTGDANGGRPVARRTPFNQTRVPVYSPWGSPVDILPDAAARMEVSAFDTLGGQEWEDLFGELGDLAVASQGGSTSWTQIDRSITGARPEPGSRREYVPGSYGRGGRVEEVQGGNPTGAASRTITLPTLHLYGPAAPAGSAINAFNRWWFGP